MIDIYQLRSLSELGPKIEQQLKAQQTQIEELSQAVQQLQQMLGVALHGPRRVRHGKNGPEGVDIMDGEGNVVASRQIIRDSHGRPTGSQ